MLPPTLAFLLLAAADPTGGPPPAEAVALAWPRLTPNDATEMVESKEGGWDLRPWKQRPGNWIALVSDITETKDSNPTAVLHIAVIGRSGQRWVALARGDETRTADEVPMGPLSYKLDLATYRLNETELAFGVREVGDDQTPTRPFTTENLLLFRITGARLARVLDLTASTIWSNANEQANGRSSSVFSVSKNKTGGFFDLVQTEWDEEEAEGSKPTSKKTVSTYAWTGTAYEKSLRTVLLQINTLDTLRAAVTPELKLVARRPGAPQVPAKVETIQPKQLGAKQFAKQIKPHLAAEPRGAEKLSCDEQARTCTFSRKSGQTTYRFTPRPAAPALAEIAYDAKGE
jgi:hypothetical protein